jgi:general transcription factor 3C polypeptide 3 (transcription factor C subunit 4)
LLQDALIHYTAIHLSGEARDNTFGLVIPGGGFSRMDLLLLADLYNVLGQYEKAIETIRIFVGMMGNMTILIASSF